MLFISVILYVSCKHYNDIQAKKDSDSFSVKANVSAAKNFFESTNSKSAIKDVKSSMFPDSKLIPDWSEGKRVSLANGLTLLVVDMPETKATSTRFSYIRKAIFFKYSSKVIEGYIV